MGLGTIFWVRGTKSTSNRWGGGGGGGWVLVDRGVQDWALVVIPICGGKEVSIVTEWSRNVQWVKKSQSLGFL